MGVAVAVAVCVAGVPDMGVNVVVVLGVCVAVAVRVLVNWCTGSTGVSGTVGRGDPLVRVGVGLLDPLLPPQPRHTTHRATRQT